MAGQLDPRKANHVTIVGRKGSGKSVLAQRFWDSYPGDRLVIDPTGDVDTRDPKAENLTLPLPLRWPRPFREDERSTLRFHPDVGSATYRDDMDAAVQLAFQKGSCLLWVDEVAELTSANNTPPAMRRVLHQSRHRRLSTLFCGPRPIDINPLVISQADYLAIFDLPNPADRKRIADVIGYDLNELEEAHGELAEHGYLWWDTRARELEVRPPIPHRAVKPGRRFEDDDQ
jgi:hypothetical protein